jgi:hypothetical protein
MMIPALVLAAYAGVASVSDRSGVSVRGLSGQSLGIDLATAPAASAEAKSRRWAFAASYSPMVVLSDVQRVPSAPAPLLFQSGSLLAAWHDRQVRLSLGESGSYGEENTTYLGVPVAAAPTAPDKPPPPPPALQILPQQSVTARIVSSQTTLAADLRASRRLSLSLRTGYGVFGGMDTASMQVVPQQHGPTADASATYVLTLSDAMVGDVAGSSSEALRTRCQAFVTAKAGTTCAPDDVIASATIGLRHAFARGQSGTLEVGGSYARARWNPTNRYDDWWYPIAVAAYHSRFGLENRHMTLNIDVQARPAVDTRTGIANYRVQTNATLARQEGSVTISELVGAARSLGNELQQADMFVVSTTTAEYRSTRNVLFTAALNYFLDSQQSAGTFSSVVASLSVTVSSSPTRF